MTGNGTGPLAGPLKGVRVLELPAIGPVPFIGMMLADLGAEVIRVDKPDSAGDIAALMAPAGNAGPLGRGRRGITLDLRDPSGLEIALDLVERVDVVLDGFRPGVAERLGIGPDVALARNPKVVFARMTGWGQEGPLASTAGHDITYLAISGLLHGIGPRDGAPTPPANYIGDFGGALTMVSGLLAALFSAERTGRGQVVDVAMTDAAAYMATMVRALHGGGLWKDERAANMLDGGLPIYRTYECADGKYLAVGCLEPKFWFTLVAALGLDVNTTPVPYDPAQHDEVIALLSGIFKSKTRDEWAALLEPLDACVAPVLTLEEAPRHPHNAERGSYITVGEYLVAAPPIRFSETPATAANSVPEAGNETHAILAELGREG